jgi:hypothetical protein
MNVTSDTLTTLLTVYQRRFGSEYNQALEGQTWKDLVLRVPSTSLKEAVPFSGAAPRVQDTTEGTLDYEDIRQYLVEVSNRVFQAGWMIEREAFSDDRYQLYGGKPGEMAEAAAEHPGEYIWQLIELNGLAYDGKAFYLASGGGRSFGKGAVVDNIVPGAGTTPANLLADLNKCQIRMFGFETDKGRKIKRMGNLISCSIDLFQNWFEALAVLNDQDAGTRTVAMPGEPIFTAGRYTVVVNPEATDADNWQLHHIAGTRRPFLMTDREAPHLEGTISVDSYEWREERVAKYSTYGRYGRGYADPRLSILVTN